MLRSLLLAALAVLFLVPSASAQQREFACNGGVGNHEVYVRVDEDKALFTTLDVTIAFDYLGTHYQNTFTLDGTEDIYNKCDLAVYAGLKGGTQQPTLQNPNNLRVPAGIPVLFTFSEPGTGRPDVTHTYVQCSGGGTVARSFYCPTVDGNNQLSNPDLVYIHDIAPPSGPAFSTTIHALPLGSGVGSGFSSQDLYPDEVFGSAEWVAPYDLNSFCSPSTTVCGGNLPNSGWPNVIGYFSTQQTAPFRFIGDLTQYDSEEWLWDLDDQTVTFEPAKRITAYGQFDVDGMTLDAADPLLGWYGIRVEGTTATSILDDATVDHVVYPTPPNPNAAFPPYAAVTATSGATVILDNDSEILNSVNANGVVSSLSGSKVTIRGASDIFDNNDGLGAVASAGAEILISGTGTSLRDNGVGGVWATGSGSDIEIRPGASIENNSGGYGATTSVSGTVRLVTPAGSPSFTSTTGNPTIKFNDGGLDTRTSGYAFTGSCNDLTGECSDGIASVSSNNNNGAFQDARANSSSAIMARNTYWDGRTDADSLFLSFGSTSSITVEPLSATQNATGGAPATSSKAGDIEPAPVSAQARQLAMDGDTGAASQMLSEALLTTTDADTRTALYSAAVYVAARGLSPLLRSQLATTAVQEGREGAWAQHALAVAALHRGDGDAWARAEALAGIADHRAAGHTLMLSMAIGDEASALAALSSFAAAVGAEASSDEQDALTSALAVVAAAYPDADLRSAFDRVPDAQHAKSGTAVQAAVLSAYPNPSAGQARVALSVADAAQATVAVYDALGRRVATLHDGDLAEGEHTFELTGDALAPGVYVVTARTTSPNGAVSTEAVRWTRMR